MNIIIISILCIFIYVFIYERWPPININKILISIIQFKRYLLSFTKCNKLEDNQPKEFNIEYFQKSDEKSNINFDYNLLSAKDTESINSNNKRPFMSNLKSWYNNSYFDSNIENNNYTVRNFNNDIDNSQIYFDNNKNYINDTNDKDIGKSISQIYDGFVYDNYVVK